MGIHHDAGPQAERGSGERLLWPDVLRGLTVVSMVLFHGMWDAVFLFGLRAPWYMALPGYLWQQSICWTFILLSGFCFRLGRHPVRRGLQVSALGLLVTAVTVLFMPEDRVVFGVLTCIGACMLLTAGLEKAAWRERVRAAGEAAEEASGLRGSAVGLGVSAALFFLTRNINSGWLGFERILIAPLPAGLYRNLFTAFFGFPAPEFYSTDYFSLIPWWFLYLCGYFLYGIWQRRQGTVLCLLKEKDRRQRTVPCLLRIFRWIGRHALLIYALHQPALMLVLTLVFRLSA